jgi:alpha-1,3-rhamnosyl/mannosyltransferase
MKDLLRLGAAVRADGLDAFLFPSVYTYFPVVGVPTVLGIHDAIVHELPRLTLDTRRDRLAWRAKETFALRTAASIFTVSEASRAAVAARFGLEPGSLRVVPEAPDDVFSPRSAAAVDEARVRLGLDPQEPYFVYAGGVSPHKNVETLIRAYAVARGRLSHCPRLVVVGDLTNDTFLSAAESVVGLAGELGLGTSVLFPGYVQDDDLAALYSGATAVVIPSLAEGFGLPAVEGAACGAPMVLSDLPAHRETLDGGAYFVPPTDVDGLATTLCAIVGDPAAARATAERGRSLAAALSWDAAVDPLRELIAQAAEGRRR